MADAFASMNRRALIGGSGAAAVLVAMPGSAAAAGGDEAIRAAVETVTQERIAAMRTSGLTNDADRLTAELTAFRARTAPVGRPTPGLKLIAATAPVRAAAGNPYIERLAKGAAADFAKPDPAWPKARADYNPFDAPPGFPTVYAQPTPRKLTAGTREAAATMQAMLWLFANDASPMRGDARLVERFLRRAHAYADALATSVMPQAIRPGENLLDEFAIQPASIALSEFARLYPDLLLPSQKAQWDAAMRVIGEREYTKAKGRPGRYVNIDIVLGVIMHTVGTYLSDATYLAEGKRLIGAQLANILPDGAYHYHESQNESHQYHQVVIRDLSLYHEISGDPVALELMRRSELYGPVSNGRVGEFWTVPSWKQLWNDPNGLISGDEPVIALTQNPMVAWMVDRQLSRPFNPLSKSWLNNRWWVSWWTPRKATRPLPDNYTCIDRNIDGPRAWYGGFTYAATLRPLPATESGHQTLIGLQSFDDRGTKGALMGVYPRVRLGEKTHLPDGLEERRSYASLTNAMRSAQATARHISAIGALYRMHRFGSSTRGAISDWNGTQIWIGLPDRIVGLVLATATKDTQAWQTEVLLRMGVGGSAFVTPQQMSQLGKNQFGYADLRIALHKQLGGAWTARTTPFRNPRAPYADLLLQDVPDATATAPRAYAAGSAIGAVVEIGLATGKPLKSVAPILGQGGLFGLSLATDDRNIAFWFNAGANAATVDLAAQQRGSGRNSLFATGAPGTAPAPAGKTATIPPGSGALLIGSQIGDDHLAGWKDFTQMIG